MSNQSTQTNAADEALAQFRLLNERMSDMVEMVNILREEMNMNRKSEDSDEESEESEYEDEGSDEESEESDKESEDESEDEESDEESELGTITMTKVNTALTPNLMITTVLNKTVYNIINTNQTPEEDESREPEITPEEDTLVRVAYDESDDEESEDESEDEYDEEDWYGYDCGEELDDSIEDGTVITKTKVINTTTPLMTTITVITKNVIYEKRDT